MPEFINSLIEFKDVDWLTLALRAFFVYLFVLWVALVIWVARDVVSRTRSLIFQVASIVLVIALSIFGLFIYLMIRPPKTLLDSYHEDIERKALIESEELCPGCEHPLPLQFRFCPTCGLEARSPCKKCRKLVSKKWPVCPYCGKRKQNEKKQAAEKTSLEK